MAAGNDIVVIGAGIVGCAVAYELARRGAAVRVVDDREAGMGATQASAGMLAPFVEAREGGPLLTLGARSLGEYDRFVASVRSASDASVEYRRAGSINVATDAAGMRDLEALAASLAASGVEARVLGPREVRAEEPQLTEAVAGGLLIPAHGLVAAHEFTRAMLSAACRLGARMIAGTRVTRVRRATGGDRAGKDALAVETTTGTITTARVVLAAGSWAGQIDIEGASAPVPVHPVRGQLLALACGSPRLRRVVWGDGCYLVPWDDGTLLIGATVENVGFDEQTTEAGVRTLIEAAAALVPSLDSRTRAEFSARAGLRPGTPDALPIIGPSDVRPGLFYATGHYRNGVLLAPLTARLAADALLDATVDPLLELTRPGRFGAF